MSEPQDVEAGLPQDEDEEEEEGLEPPPDAPPAWTSGWDDDSNDVDPDPHPHGACPSPLPRLTGVHTRTSPQGRPLPRRPVATPAPHTDTP